MSHLIPNQFIQWHFAALADDSALTEKLKREQHLPEEIFTTRGKLISADQYADLLLSTNRIQGQESFGQLRQPLGRGCFQLMCHACIHCNTLEQAIERSLQFYRLMNPQIRWRLVTDDEVCRIQFDLDRVDEEKAGYFIAFYAVIIWRWLSWMISKQIPLKKVDFAFPSPGCETDIQAIFQQQVTFNQPTNALYFPAEWLRQSVRQNASSLELFLVHVPECLLSHYQQEISVRRQLREFLSRTENLNKVLLAEAAAYFCCSEQSLIRKLRSEGTRFKAEVDEMLKQRALNLLQHSALSNQQIAMELHFTDPSVFYRKCRKWFGCAPGQIRQDIYTE